MQRQRGSHTLERRPEAVAEELRQELARLREADPFEVLAVRPGASRDEVEAAFLKLVPAHHPHRFAKYGSAEVTRLSTELFVLLGQHRDRCLGKRRKRRKKRTGDQRPTPATARAEAAPKSERQGLLAKLFGRKKA